MSVPELNFSVEVTGFSIPEIETLIDGMKPQDQGDPADERLPAVAEIAVSRLGDRWVLGEHKLVCGDCRDPASFQALLGELEHADMVFTDPPYNVPINGHVAGKGRTRHREFAMASGEMSAAAFTAFLTSVFERLTVYTTRWLDPLRLHGLEAPLGDPRGRRRGLLGAQEPHRVGEGQRRDGQLLSLPPRTRLRLQERHGAPHQLLRARPERALPDERLELPGNHVAERESREALADAPDR